MRRRKEAVLDFTSLLDIVLIILFFFILFSYMETGEAREKAEAAVSEAAAISETADRREAEAEYKIKEAENAKQQAMEALGYGSIENPLEYSDFPETEVEVPITLA